MKNSFLMSGLILVIAVRVLAQDPCQAELNALNKESQAQAKIQIAAEKSFAKIRSNDDIDAKAKEVKYSKDLEKCKADGGTAKDCKDKFKDEYTAWQKALDQLTVDDAAANLAIGAIIDLAKETIKPLAQAYIDCEKLQTNRENKFENSQDNGLSIYPNPSSGDFLIQYNSSNSAQVELIAYDMMGKEVMNQIEAVSKGSNTFNIIQPELSPGIYIVEVRNGMSVIKGKFIIEK